MVVSMTDEYRLRAWLDDDRVKIEAYGLNAEVRCKDGMLQLRKYPTGVLLKEVECPRSDRRAAKGICLCVLSVSTLDVKEDWNG